MMGYWFEARLLEYLLDELYPFRLTGFALMALGVVMERERPSQPVED